MIEILYGLGMLGLLVLCGCLVLIIGKEVQAYNKALVVYLKEKEK